MCGVESLLSKNNAAPSLVTALSQEELKVAYGNGTQKRRFGKNIR
jgi:hypothetical protein